MLENLNCEKGKILKSNPNINKIFLDIPNDWVLTPNDIADLIGISVVTVRRWCRQGKITAYQFERKYVVTGEHFKSFMKNSIVRRRIPKGANIG